MKKWQFWLGAAISAIFIYLVVRDLDFSRFILEVKEANYWWILPGIGVYFIGVWVRSWRWHYLLRPLKAVPTKKMFPIVTMGYAGNNIIPARAGEVLRAVILKRKEGIPISASLATIIVERVFDGVVMLAFIFLNLAELAKLTKGGTLISGFTIQDIAIIGTVFFIGALIVFLIAAMFPTITKSIAEWFINRLLPERLRERVLGLVDKFLGGLESLRSPKDALMVFFTSVVIWLLETFKYWFVMHAFGFSVSFFALMLMNGVVNLATTIPAAPGYVGTFDLPGIAILMAYGVEKALATSYTFVLHFALWLPITVVGLYYLAREGISWTGGDINELREEINEN